MIGSLLALGRAKTDPLFSRILIIAGTFGFCWLLIRGFSIGLRGWQFGWLEALFGPLGDRQFGMGYGAMLMANAYRFMFTRGIAGRGAINGDVFVVSAISLVVTIVTIFVFFPVARGLARPNNLSGNCPTIPDGASEFVQYRQIIGIVR